MVTAPSQHSHVTRALKRVVLLCLTLATCASASSQMPDSTPLTVAKKTGVLNMVQQNRQQAIDAINSTHGSMAGEAWGFSLGSAGSNWIPSEFGGTLVGMGADTVLLVGWFARCKSRYGDASGVDKLFNQLSDELISTLTSPSALLTCARMPSQIIAAVKKLGQNAANAAIEQNVARAYNGRIFQLVQGRLKRVQVWRPAMPGIAEDIAAEEAEHQAEQEALRVAEGEFVHEAEGEAGQVLARGGVERGVEAGIGWIPILGNIASAAIALAVMRWSTGNVNDTFRDDYIKAVHAVYDTAHDTVNSLPTQ